MDVLHYPRSADHRLILAGAAMAISGLVMQLMTQNRFVEPSTVGTTEWAGLGLLVTMILFPGASIMVRMIGAIGFVLLRHHRFLHVPAESDTEVLFIVPIIGIMLGAVVGITLTFIALQNRISSECGKLLGFPVDSSRLRGLLRAALYSSPSSHHCLLDCGPFHGCWPR